MEGKFWNLWQNWLGPYVWEGTEADQSPTGPYQIDMTSTKTLFSSQLNFKILIAEGGGSGLFYFENSCFIHVSTFYIIIYID